MDIGVQSDSSSDSSSSSSESDSESESESDEESVRVTSPKKLANVTNGNVLSEDDASNTNPNKRY